MIYLDHAATTPVDPEVVAAMQTCLGADGDFANPSSDHAPGRAARARVEAARAAVAAAIGARAGEIVFTSGATEADQLALAGVLAAAPAGRARLVTLRSEHRAVLDLAREFARRGQPVTLLDPGPDGRLAPEELAAALGPDVALVSIMLVNNETGVVQDLAGLAPLVHAAGALLHSDCAQAVGKLAVDVRALGLDLAAFSAHKCYGPKGVGALWVRDGVSLVAQTHGGGQERGLRSGTLATPGIVGMGVAFARATRDLTAELARVAGLRAALRAGLLTEPGVFENGAPEHCVPHILSVSCAGVQGESLIAALDGLAVSGGSACNAAHAEPSAVLRAMGRDPLLAAASLRFSLGRATTLAQVERAAALVRAALQRLRAAAPAGPA